MSKLKQAEGQDRNVFNALKRIVRDLPKLTDEQLAILHFETWHEARVRAGVSGVTEDE